MQSINDAGTQAQLKAVLPASGRVVRPCQLQVKPHGGAQLTLRPPSLCWELFIMTIQCYALLCPETLEKQDLPCIYPPHAAQVSISSDSNFCLCICSILNELNAHFSIVGHD